MSDVDNLPCLGQGPYWQELSVGQKFKTFRRTITEADLVGFIGITGMLEVIFTDVSEDGGAMGGRPVPAALTQGIIEGFQMQTLVQGTGKALLEIHTTPKAPVYVGDSIWAVIEVKSVRPASKRGYGVVGWEINVFNQRSELVMHYTVTRLIAGKP